MFINDTNFLMTNSVNQIFEGHALNHSNSYGAARLSILAKIYYQIHLAVAKALKSMENIWKFQIWVGENPRCNLL